MAHGTLVLSRSEVAGLLPLAACIQVVERAFLRHARGQTIAPIVPELAQLLGAEILLIGFGLPGENAHAPNEWIALENLRRGARAMVRLYHELGSMEPGPHR